MGTRRKSRELCLQMLFQADLGRQNADDVRRTFWAERKEVGDDVRGFADDLFRTASDRTGDIDKLIEGHAEHWRMERMAAVDRNTCAQQSRVPGLSTDPASGRDQRGNRDCASSPALSRCSSSMEYSIASAVNSRRPDPSSPSPSERPCTLFPGRYGCTATRSGLQV